MTAVGHDTDLYQEVQHFYGRQMRHLDEDRIDEWVATFTEDGVFAANAHPEPARGREAIRTGARAAKKLYSDKGIQRRHWLGMLEVEQAPDGEIIAKTYALIITTPRGGQAAVTLSTSCDDRLVRQEGGLLVKHRQVYRDDLPKG